MSKPKKPHSVTLELKPADKRERKTSNLETEIRQPVDRILTAAKLHVLRRGGLMRVADMPECSKCGATAPPGRPDDTPWLVGSQKISCTGGCELGPRELLEILCPTDKELDDLLAKISVGHAALTRFFVLELQVNTPAEGEAPKRRRAIGTDVIATLARLEPIAGSIVRGVVIDAIDLMAVHQLVRGEGAETLPWCPRIELDYRGELADVHWHGAELSFAERELMRRRARMAV